MSSSAIHTTFHVHLVRLLWALESKEWQKQNSKALRSVVRLLNTRAVHCELATDASRIVGADREFRLMIEGWDKTKLKEFCAERGKIWQLTTPLAPNQNGCSESLVKTTKSCLKKGIGEAVVTPFELYTCFLEAANLVNELPIERIPNDPDDGAYLCPN